MAFLFAGFPVKINFITFLLFGREVFLNCLFAGRISLGYNKENQQDEQLKINQDKLIRKTKR